MNCRYDGTNDGRQSYIKMVIDNFTVKRQYASENGKQFHMAMYDAIIGALKKEVATPVMKAWDKSIGGHSYYRYVCPECENVLRPSTRGKYCPNFGQKLEWEDSHDKR